MLFGSSLIIVVIIDQLSYATKGELINDPTVTAANPFDVNEDCRVIRKQLKKWIFPNLKTVMHILCHRTYDQRKVIEDTYNHKYCIKTNDDGEEESKCSLSHGIKVTSVDDIRSLNIKLFESPESMLATSVRDTIDEIHNYHDLEEIICAQDNPMKHRIQQYYKQTYGLPLEAHFPLYKPGDAAYQTAILKYCWPQRRQDLTITLEIAQQESMALLKIDYINDKETFKNKFKGLLDKYSDADLKLIFQNYRLSGQGIDTSIDAAFAGDEKTAFNVLARYIEDTCKYYSDKLKETTGSWGDIRQADRIILTRSERDLMCILKKFEADNGETFTNAFEKSINLVTQNSYMMALRYLCGKP